MNDDRTLEQRFADAMHAEPGPARLPDAFYDDFHKRAGDVRQRPRWLAILKEPPMRYRSHVAFGSPTARLAAFAVATLLVAILGASALVAGAQSTSPDAPDDAAISPPVAFTGQIICGPPVRTGTTAWSSWDEGRTWRESRGDAWRQAFTMSDPRLEGEVHQSVDSYRYSYPGSDGIETRTLTWVTYRIENDEGAWQGATVSFDLPGEPDIFTPGDRQTYLLIGEGGYEGLTAIFDAVPNAAYRPCGGDAYGLVFEGVPAVAEPFTGE